MPQANQVAPSDVERGNSSSRLGVTASPSGRGPPRRARRERAGATRPGFTYRSTISRLPSTPELVEQEADLLRLGGEDLVLRLEVPQLALERPERLLARRVHELLVGLVRLALVERVGEAPRLDLLVELARERRVLVEQVLEARREVDLRRLDVAEAMEQLVRQRRGAVLDRAGERRTRAARPRPAARGSRSRPRPMPTVPSGMTMPPCDVPVWTLTLLIPMRARARCRASSRCSPSR